jgi:transcriptional regulator with GAF, ATPase, and Fis domain
VRSERELLVTDAFVSLADSLVGPFDVVELLNGLTEVCARLLDVASAGLLLADRSGVLHVVAASSERTRSLELFQLQRDEGPCLQCYRTGVMVCVPDLQGDSDRWPQFVPAALNLGFVSVHAVPMRLNDQILGTLGLFGVAVGSLNDEDLSLAQALAHVASVALVTGNATADQDRLTQQLQIALDSRVLIEQAKGAIAQFSMVSMDEAFALLRDYARDHNEKLTEIARSVVARTLSIREISSHSLAKQSPPS